MTLCFHPFAAFYEGKPGGLRTAHWEDWVESVIPSPPPRCTSYMVMFRRCIHSGSLFIWDSIACLEAFQPVGFSFAILFSMLRLRFGVMLLSSGIASLLRVLVPYMQLLRDLSSPLNDVEKLSRCSTTLFSTNNSRHSCIYHAVRPISITYSSDMRNLDA